MIKDLYSKNRGYDFSYDAQGSQERNTLKADIVTRCSMLHIAVTVDDGGITVKRTFDWGGRNP